jgi:hypothetical protein
VAYLLSDTPKHEIERLLIDVLPRAFLHAIKDQGSTAEEDRHLVVCHRNVFDAAPQDIKAKVTKNLYKIYRSAQEPAVVIYEENFFRGSDLIYLSEDERRFIKAHFLPRVSLETLHDLLYNLVGIGPFLDPEEANSLGTILMLAQGEDKSLAERALVRLLNEYVKMTSDSRAEVRSAAESFGDEATLGKLERREAKLKASSSGDAARA